MESFSWVKVHHPYHTYSTPQQFSAQQFFHSQQALSKESQGKTSRQANRARCRRRLEAAVSVGDGVLRGAGVRNAAAFAPPPCGGTL